MLGVVESYEELAAKSRAESERAAALNLPKARDFASVAELEDRLADLHAQIGRLKDEERTARQRGTFDYFATQIRRVANGETIEHPTVEHRQADVVARELAITQAALEPVQRKLTEARREAAIEAMRTARPIYDKAAKRLKKALESAVAAFQETEDIRQHFREQSMPLIECPELAYMPDLPKYWLSDLEKRGY